MNTLKLVKQALKITNVQHLNYISSQQGYFLPRTKSQVNLNCNGNQQTREPAMKHDSRGTYLF